METTLGNPNAIEIKIGNVDLATKLNAIGAALEAVRLAHRDEMPVECWAALNQAEERIAEATMKSRGAGVLPLRLNT